MVELIIAFILGNLVHRIYYARISTRTDWMKSWDWSKNKYYRLLHRFSCEICPKRWYCKRYKEEIKKGD
ncbi:MAG: hypothetical protein PVG65_05595 [Candidatus Thorarchaeota archaeon]|jgi:hypothetical protein